MRSITLQITSQRSQREGRRWMPVPALLSPLKPALKIYARVYSQIRLWKMYVWFFGCLLCCVSPCAGSNAVLSMGANVALTFCFDIHHRRTDSDTRIFTCTDTNTDAYTHECYGGVSGTSVVTSFSTPPRWSPPNSTRRRLAAPSSLRTFSSSSSVPECQCTSSSPPGLVCVRHHSPCPRVSRERDPE